MKRPEPDAETPPLLRILTAGATDEEVAALVAVISSLAAPGGAKQIRPVPAWSAHQRKARTPHLNGPGGWRASGLPG